MKRWNIGPTWLRMNGLCSRLSEFSFGGKDWKDENSERVHDDAKRSPLSMKVKDEKLLCSRFELNANLPNFKYRSAY